MDDHPERVNWKEAENMVLNELKKLESDLMNNECRLQENISKSRDIFQKKILEINGEMENQANKLFGEIELIIQRFKNELQEKSKSYLEQQNKVFERFNNGEDVGDEFDASAQEFVQNPDMAT